MAPPPEYFDFTAKATRRLLDEHAAGIPRPAIEQMLAKAQAAHPRALVTWDDELDDVVIDFTSGGR